MTRLLSGLLSVMLSALAVSTSALAETRVLILRDESAVARQTSELLEREIVALRWSATVTVIPAGRSLPQNPDGEQVMVALGGQAVAIALKHSGGKPVIAALLSQSVLEDTLITAGDRLSAILLDQPAERWINLIQSAFPGIQEVGMLAGKSTQKTARALERKMSDRRLGLAIESVAAPEDVVPAIERLVPRMALLLALPDPMVHNRNTVQPLLLTTYRAGIPVVAYSESYQQAGAVVALYSTVPQIVAQITDTLQLVREGRSLPAVQSPRYYTVGVNSAVARSLGLSLPSAADLNGRLRSMGQ
jgi:ABC-type uncharacterized transport system substrate-binding protein